MTDRDVGPMSLAPTVNRPVALRRAFTAGPSAPFEGSRESWLHNRDKSARCLTHAAVWESGECAPQPNLPFNK